MGYVVRQAAIVHTTIHTVKCRMCPKPLKPRERHIIVDDKDRFHTACFLKRADFELALFTKRIQDLETQVELHAMTDEVGRRIGVGREEGA